MASLNTLRTKGGLIISIVIGVALLAFLVGDFMPGGNNDPVVGAINGNKVKYLEYSRLNDRYEAIAQAMSGRESLSATEQEQVRSMTWESLIMTHSYQPGFDNLGIWPREAEQVDMVGGAYLSPVMEGAFANQQTGEFDPEIMRNFVANIDADPSGRTAMVWNYLKEQMNNQRVTAKFAHVVKRGFFVNDLEVERALAVSNNTYKARVAVKEYSSIPDSLVVIAGADIRKYYDAHRARFKRQPGRQIEYVLFDLEPSEQDYEEARKYVDMIAGEFTESATPMQYATLNSQTRPEDHFVSQARMEAAMAAAIWGKPEAVYGPVLDGNIYTIAREGEVRMMPDSLGARHILVAADKRALADSLAGAVRAGGDFAALAQQFSTDQTANLKGGDLGRFAPEQMVEQFSTPLMGARVGEVLTIETPFGIHVAQLTYKSAPVRKAQIATIKYKVEPSSATQQKVYGEASEFLASANGSYENFRKATSEAALSNRVAQIANTDRDVRGLEESRELVRWAFNGTRGDVSPIMEIGGNYVVATLTEVREAGIASVEDVAENIRPYVMRDKKAEMIIPQIKGATLDEATATAEMEVREVENINLQAFYIDNVGVELKLMGAIAATAPNTLSKPVRGESGVYIFEVTEAATTENTTTETQKTTLETANENYLPERLTQALQEAAKVTDNRVKYF